MWRSKVLTFCLILCLGVSTMGRLFSVSASVWSNNPQYWYTVAKMVNLTNMGYTIHVPADTTLNDLVNFFGRSDFDLALPQSHKRAIDSAVQTADINGYTVQDVYIPYGPGNFYSALYHDFYYNPYQSEDLPSPYFDALSRINNYSNLGFADSPQIFEDGFYGGDPFNYIGYSIVNTATASDEDGNTHGTLDFFTVDGSQPNGYYVTAQYPYMVFGEYDDGEYGGTTFYTRSTNLFVCDPIAVLVPSEEDWAPASAYSHNFTVGDEVRYIDDVNASYVPYTGIECVYQYLHHHQGENDYPNYFTPCELASYGLYSTPIAFASPTTYRAFSGISVSMGSYYGDPITYADFINYLSGYFRAVKIYAGSSWADCEELPLSSSSAPGGITVTRPDTTPAIRSLNSDEFLNLGPCYLYLSTIMHGQAFDLDADDWPIEARTQPIDPTTTPYPTGEPTGSPAPVVTNPPANITPEPTPDIEIVVYPPNIPGNIEVPIWGNNNNGDMPDGLFSTYVGSWYGLTPPPSESLRTVQASVNSNSEYNDVADNDSATSVATGVVEAGTAFLGPISQYIWYIVAFGVVVTLIVKFLHG